MERLIIMDTETTGLSPAEGHRVVEIGCVELLNKRKGTSWQRFLNPEREIPAEAIRIHGITSEKVAGAPKFKEIAQGFLDFIGDDPLVIHNAAFDLGFLNAELARLKRPPLKKERAIDTMILARRKFPGAAANLNALCKKLKVDNSHRVLHGALLDADLLAEVYVELTGGRQFSLELGSEPESRAIASPPPRENTPYPARTWPLTDKEKAEHGAYLAFLNKESGGCLWMTQQ